MSQKIRDTITKQDVGISSPKIRPDLLLSKELNPTTTTQSSVMLSTKEVMELTNRLAYEH